MIPESENPQEGKRICPGSPARHAQADPGRYFTQSTMLVGSNAVTVQCTTQKGILAITKLLRPL